MAVTSKVDGLPWVRLIEPKHDPSPPRSTRLPWASCTSAAPGPQHVEVVVVAAALDEPGAPAEVLDAHPRREGVEHGVRQHVEGLVVREEVARLGQLDVEGHGPIVAAVGDAGAVASTAVGAPGERHPSTNGHPRRSQSPERSVRLLE